jgi:hypothetical protein
MADFPPSLPSQISPGNTARRLTHVRKFKSLLRCPRFRDTLAQLSQFSSVTLRRVMPLSRTHHDEAEDPWAKNVA